MRALALRYFVGLGPQETAERMGWSIDKTRESIELTRIVLELQLEHFSVFDPDRT